MFNDCLCETSPSRMTNQIPSRSHHRNQVTIRPSYPDTYLITYQSICMYIMISSQSLTHQNLRTVSLSRHSDQMLLTQFQIWEIIFIRNTKFISPILETMHEIIDKKTNEKLLFILSDYPFDNISDISLIARIWSLLDIGFDFGRIISKIFECCKDRFVDLLFVF